MSCQPDINEPRDELLISRAVGGDAGSAEWDELEARAAQDDGLWRRLGAALRDQTSLSRALDASAPAGAVVDLPRAPTAAGTAAVLGRLAGWSGWAIAAALALAWSLGALVPGPRGTQAPEPGQLVQTASAADLFQAYLDKGREEDSVVAEIPQRVLLESRPAATGDGYELLYLRQVVERTVVPDLYEVRGQDEAGRATLTRYEQPRRPSM